MKKQCIILGALLVMTTGLQGMQALKYDLSAAASSFKMYALTKEWSDMTNNAFTQWDTAFAKAKSFVLNNSKNLMGTEDVDLINAMRNAEQANTSLLAIINKIRGLSDLNAIEQQKTPLENLRNNIKNFMNNLNNATMMLSSKKEAKEIILKIGSELEEMITSALSSIMWMRKTTR